MNPSTVLTRLLPNSRVYCIAGLAVLVAKVIRFCSASMYVWGQLAITAYMKRPLYSRPRNVNGFSDLLGGKNMHACTLRNSVGVENMTGLIIKGDCFS